MVLPVATLLSVLPLLVARVASCTVSCMHPVAFHRSAPGELGPHRRTRFHAAVVSSAYHAEVSTLAQPWPPAGPGCQFACLRVVKVREAGKPRQRLLLLCQEFASKNAITRSQCTAKLGHSSRRRGAGVCVWWLWVGKPMQRLPSLLLRGNRCFAKCIRHRHRRSLVCLAQLHAGTGSA